MLPGCSIKSERQDKESSKTTLFSPPGAFATEGLDLWDGYLRSGAAPKDLSVG